MAMFSAWARGGDCPELHINPLQQRRKISCSKGAMAKIGTILAILAVVCVFTLLVLADSNGQGKKGKTRGNNIYRRRRIKDQNHPQNQNQPNTTPITLLDQNIHQNLENNQMFGFDPNGSNNTIGHLRVRSPQEDFNENNNSMCSECIQENCVISPINGCSTELVLDSCSCCYICGISEGNRCFNSSFNLPYNESESGICAPGMSCLLRNDLDPTEGAEAVCECRDKRMVCGSDNETYTSECKLREMAVQNGNLFLASWNPCVSAPWISTTIENATSAVGEDVSLSCEVKAFPPPIIYWEFLQESEENTAMPSILPGDDASIVVLVRGGPDQMMTTSWIQMISVSARRQGKYFCNAKNSEGMTQSHAFVSIYKKSFENFTTTAATPI